MSEEIKSEEMILTVLNEALEELKTANKSLKDVGQKVATLETRVKAFDAKEIRIEPPNLEPLNGKIDELPVVMTGKLAEIDDRLNKGIATVCTTLRDETAAGLTKLAVAVETQPKPIIRRISFFPDYDREGNYKTFIRWLIGGIVGVMLVGSAYVLGNEWIARTRPQPEFTDSFRMNIQADTPQVPKTTPAPVKKHGKHSRER